MKHPTPPIIIERDAEGFYVSCPPLKVEVPVSGHATNNPLNEDPLLSLRGSGRHLWADEPADDYIRRLREG